MVALIFLFNQITILAPVFFYNEIEAGHHPPDMDLTMMQTLTLHLYEQIFMVALIGYFVRVRQKST